MACHAFHQKGGLFLPGFVSLLDEVISAAILTAFARQMSCKSLSLLSAWATPPGCFPRC